MYSIPRYYNLRSPLISKIENLTRLGQNFSPFSELILTFITRYRNMTCKYYLKQPKSMLEKKLIAKLAKHLALIQTFDSTTYHPLTHRNFNIVGEHQNLVL